jgi:hypothetical protein
MPSPSWDEIEVSSGQSRALHSNFDQHLCQKTTGDKLALQASLAQVLEPATNIKTNPGFSRPPHSESTINYWDFGLQGRPFKGLEST